VGRSRSAHREQLIVGRGDGRFQSEGQRHVGEGAEGNECDGARIGHDVIDDGLGGVLILDVTGGSVEGDAAKGVVAVHVDAVGDVAHQREVDALVDGDVATPGDVEQSEGVACAVFDVPVAVDGGQHVDGKLVGRQGQQQGGRV